MGLAEVLEQLWEQPAVAQHAAASVVPEARPSVQQEEAVRTDAQVAPEAPLVQRREERRAEVERLSAVRVALPWVRLLARPSDLQVLALPLAQR